jgi:hypothetical protein
MMNDHSFCFVLAFLFWRMGLFTAIRLGATALGFGSREFFKRNIMLHASS